MFRELTHFVGYESWFFLARILIDGETINKFEWIGGVDNIFNITSNYSCSRLVYVERQ